MEIPPEGPEDEWKERLPAPARLARTLSAFANGTGGRIWVGVADSGGLPGVLDRATVEDALGAALALLDPAPRVSFHPFQGPRDQLLVRIEVEALCAGLSFVDTGRSPRRAYLRDRDRTRALDPSDQKALATSRESRALEEQDRRLLSLLARHDGLCPTDLAKKARIGLREVKRRLVALRQAGLLLEQDGGRMALTPRGYQRHKGLSKRRAGR